MKVYLYYAWDKCGWVIGEARPKIGTTRNMTNVPSGTHYRFICDDYVYRLMKKLGVSKDELDAIHLDEYYELELT